MEAFRSILFILDLDKIATLGGDCGVDMIPISYLNKKYKCGLGIFWIDAHADIHTPESSPSQNFHGMPIRIMMGKKAMRVYWSSFFQPLGTSNFVIWD